MSEPLTQESVDHFETLVLDTVKQLVNERLPALKARYLELQTDYLKAASLYHTLTGYSNGFKSDRYTVEYPEMCKDPASTFTIQYHRGNTMTMVLDPGNVDKAINVLKSLIEQYTEFHSLQFSALVEEVKNIVHDYQKGVTEFLKHFEGALATWNAAMINDVETLTKTCKECLESPLPSRYEALEASR